jgi:tetratricopeptide (TPR) repeat protein
MGDEHLQRFAQAVVELQTKNEQRVDEEAVRRVAQELGMSDEDLQKAREDSRARKLRAQTMRSAGALDEAIAELEIGYGLNPLDLEIGFALADALYLRSQKNASHDDWARAKQLILEVIEAAPAQKEAPGLLNAIVNNDPDKKGDNSIPIAVIVAGAAAVLLVAGVVLHFVVGLF